MVLCRTESNGQVEALDAKLAETEGLLTAAEQSSKAFEEQLAREQSNVKQLQQRYDEVCATRFAFLLHPG